MKIKIYQNLDNIFSILSKSLFVICGGGGTAYESAYFNCVTFFITRVSHQKRNINFFLKNSFGKKLPHLSKKKELNIFFERYLLNKKFILVQQKISKKIISSNGISQLVKLIKDKLILSKLFNKKDIINNYNKFDYKKNIQLINLEIKILKKY